jgi:zinc transport system ATP-binding protein
MSFLEFEFMQRALVAAILVGCAAPAIGTFLVQRRLALMGDGIGHIALTGVALGFLLGTAPVLTAIVVASGRTGRARRLRPFGRSDHAAIDHALEDVGLSHRAKDPVATLSGGQQKRVLIARALAGEPDVLVLDEPTAGVDADSQDTLAGALGHLSRQGGSVVLVAHELGPLAEHIGRAVVMSGGRVVSDGPPPEPEGHHAHAGHVHTHAHASEAPGRPTVLEPRTFGP